MCVCLGVKWEGVGLRKGVMVVGGGYPHIHINISFIPPQNVC